MYTFLEKTVEGFSPLTNIELIENLKQEFKTGTTYCRIEFTDSDNVITESDYLKDIAFSELRFVPDSGIFGECVAKKVDLNIYNDGLQFVTEDKEFVLYIGVKYEGKEYFIKYGTFIVQKPENETTNENTSFVAFDYMIKANQSYMDRNLYPCTLRTFAEYICEDLGLELSTEAFRNEDFIVEDNQFVNGESYRNVLQGIAMCAFSWCRVDEDNILHFDSLNKDSDIVEEIDIENYFNLNIKDLEFGPVNRVVIRDSQIEGENVTVQDDESIEENGLTEIVIADNPFAYTQEKREQLIEAGKELFGFRYMPINSVSLIGFAYLNCIDKIRFKTPQNENLDTFVFNHIINYNGTLLDEIQAPALTKTETKYAYIRDSVEQRMKRTEIIVNKQEGTITAIAEDVGQYDSRISTVEQSVDELSQKVETIADIVRSVNTTTGSLIFNEVNQSEPVKINIHPIGKNISYLYPNTNLFPSNDLFMTQRTLRFYNKTEKEEVLYELPVDLLYYDSETYDEFILDYENQSCIVKKKVGYNADGTTYVLTNPETLDFSDNYPTIDLKTGDYEISLLGYDSGYIDITLMIKNAYTSQFATHIEVSSEISQKANEITLQVNKTIEEETSGAAIILKVNEDNTSETKFKADKISLEGATTINGGFKVDEEGNASIANDTVTINQNGIQLADGASIVNANGLLTNLQFLSSSEYGHEFGGYAALGFDLDSYTNFKKGQISIDVFIPDNFVVKEAKVTIFHTPIQWAYEDNGTKYVTGVCRNIQLYRTTSNYSAQFTWGGEANMSIVGVVISNAFGNSTAKTFTNTTVGSVEKAETIDLKDYITEGYQKFYFETTNSASNMGTAAANTGFAWAVMNIYGYLKEA